MICPQNETLTLVGTIKWEIEVFWVPRWAGLMIMVLKGLVYYELIYA